MSRTYPVRRLGVARAVGRVIIISAMSRQPLCEVGEAPDPRFTFANERTFLAWNRTALALIGGGLAAGPLPGFKNPGGGGGGAPGPPPLRGAAAGGPSPPGGGTQRAR